MADSVNVRASGSWVGDTLDEWKKLPTWGKIVAGLVVLVVVVYAIRVYSNRSNTTAATPVSSSTGARASGLSASNYPQDSGAPIPYQPNYMQPPVSTTNATTTKPSLFTVLTRGLTGPWAKDKDDGTGGVPIWTDPNADWSKSPGGIPLNQQIQVGQSVQGNYFGKPATYYPVSYQGKTGYIGSWDLGDTPPVQGTPPPNSSPVGQGSSGDNRGFHFVRYGENMSRVARAYGLKSWRDFGVPEFWHGQKLGIPA